MGSLARKPADSSPVADPRRRAGSTLVGYALAALGPISVSAAHFLLSFSMLHVVSQDEFGRFTFLLVAAQFGWGVWSALFCAPLPIFITCGARGDWEAGRDMLLGANLIGAALMLAVFAALAMALDAPFAVVACYAVFGALSLIRWFMRGYAYFENQQVRAVTSDAVYGGCVLAAAAVFHFGLGVDPELACFAGLLVGGLAGLVPFAAALSSGARRIPGAGFAGGYAPVWRDQSRWALLGVVTTEATANAHVYLVTFALGPAAFAPLAAAALLLRPLGVVQLALADFERPRLARLVSSGGVREVRRSLAQFQLALALVWTVTAVATALLFLYGADLVFPAEYDEGTLFVATVLWLLVSAARSVQVPPAAVLGVVGEFRRLALASVWSSLVCVVSVGVVVAAFDPVWSIGALLLGALVFTALTVRIHRRWFAGFAGRRGADPAAAAPGDGA